MLVSDTVTDDDRSRRSERTTAVEAAAVPGGSESIPFTPVPARRSVPPSVAGRELGAQPPVVVTARDLPVASLPPDSLAAPGRLATLPDPRDPESAARLRAASWSPPYLTRDTTPDPELLRASQLTSAYPAERGVEGGSAPPVAARGEPQPDLETPPPVVRCRDEPMTTQDFGRLIAGRYRIVDRLARGGIGSVYLAEHVVLRSPVALKLLQPHVRDLPELVARFEREAIVGAHVKHPNIAAATDFGTLPDGSCYLVLELVEGTTLEKAMESGPFGPRRAAAVAYQIADALSALHERGVVHRDLKPSNVMVVEQRNGRRSRDLVKIIDFGLAKLDPNRLPAGASDPDETGDRLTCEGIVFGTVAYLAPEAGLGMAAVDERSDLYALGLVLYRMLAGRHPFLATNDVELFRQQVETPPPPFAESAPAARIEPALEAIVRRLLEKDPGARFQSAAEVADALAAHTGSVLPRVTRRPPARASAPRATARSLAEADADHAPPAPTAERRSHGSRRQWPWWPAVAGALTALVAGLAAVTWFWSPWAPPTPRRSASVATPPSLTLPVLSTAPAPSAAPNAAPNAAVPPSSPPVADTHLLLQARYRDSIECRSWTKAYTDFQRLARLDDPLFATEAGRRDLVALLVALAHADLPEARDMVRTLAYDLGPSGHDALFQVLLLRGGSRAHALVTEVMREPMLRARLSRPLAVALRLHLLGCDLSNEIYAEAVAHGDARALMTLGGQRERCRRHPARERAYRALEQRLLVEQGSPPPRPTASNTAGPAPSAALPANDAAPPEASALSPSALDRQGGPSK